MKREIHTALGAHIEALYERDGKTVDCFVPALRGPVQDESAMSDPGDQEAARVIEAGKFRR